MAGTVRSKPYQEFLQAMAAARRDRGVSQAALASKLGKPPSFVAKYELGERRLDVVEVFIILKVLDIDPVAFLGETLTDLPTRLANRR